MTSAEQRPACSGIHLRSVSSGHGSVNSISWKAEFNSLLRKLVGSTPLTAPQTRNGSVCRFKIDFTSCNAACSTCVYIYNLGEGLKLTNFQIKNLHRFFTFSTNLLFVFIQEGGIDSCRGDSGGSLSCVDPVTRKVIRPG